jgi:hypothetical protein
MRADHSLHGLETSAVTRVRDAGVSGSGLDNMRLILRIAALKADAELRSLSSPSENTGVKSAVREHNDLFEIPRIGKANTFQTTYCLEGRKDAVEEDALEDLNRVAGFISCTLRDTMKKIEAPINAGLSGCKTLPPHPTLSPTQVLHLFLAIQGNAHQITTPTSRRPIGLGLFPMTSMLNHSCSPNCAHQFWFHDVHMDTPAMKASVPKLMMKAIHSINVGEELCYSYIPLYASTEERRTQLFKTYSFMCQCERCRQPVEIGVLASSSSAICSQMPSTCHAGAHLMSGSEDSTEYSEFVTDVQRVSACVQGYEDFNLCKYSQPGAMRTGGSEQDVGLVSSAADRVIACVSEATNKWILSPTPKRKEFLSSMGHAHQLCMTMHSYICKGIVIASTHADMENSSLVIAGLRCGQLALGAVLKYAGCLRMKEVGMLEACVASLLRKAKSACDDRNPATDCDAETSLDQFSAVLLTSITVQQDQEYITPVWLDVSEKHVADLYSYSVLLAYDTYRHNYRTQQRESGVEMFSFDILLKCFEDSAAFTARINYIPPW